MTTAGLAGAVMIRVGNEYGKKDYAELKKAGSIGLLLGVSIMSFFGLVFIVLRNHLPLLYLSDNNVVPVASSLLIIAAFFQIFDGTQVVGLGILRGMVDVKIPMFMAFIAYWIISIPVAYVLGFKLGYGVEGVWVGLSIGLITAALFFTYRFYSSVNKKMTLP
jgi:MATE family multidrug resistance protein